MAEPKQTAKKAGKKAGKKKRAEPVYVPVQYPFWLGAASFAWAVVGWLGAAVAPRLTFLPAAGVLHLLLPAVTVALLGANLALAVRALLRGAHVLRLAPVTGVQVALFTTLFFQLYAHVGAELYDAPGATGPWHWLQFSAAHALRAGDVFDAVEAYGWGFQSVKHTSPLVGAFVVAYHVVVDVFFLGLVWAAVGRFREAVLDDDELRGMIVRLGLVAFAVWFVAWVVVAFFLRPWRPADVPLWFLENFVRVVDFADVMESFGVRFHTLPREGVVGTLTVLCRLWIAIGLAVLATRKRKPPPRRVLTPPGVAPGPYWRVRGLALGGMAAGMVAAGLVGWAAAGQPAEGLAAAVKEGPEDRSQSALRGLRRMGPSAAAAVPELTAARPAAPPGVRDEITRTLGYLGADAAPALRDIALADPPESAGVAVDALATVGGPAAPALVAVWEAAPSDAVRDRAEAGLRRVGGEAVGPLIDGFTPATAHGHFVWLQRLDPNWRLRATDNPVAGACQRLPDLLQRANGSDPAGTAAALGEMRACGSASKVALDTLIEHLGHKDAGVQAAAAGLVTAIGPAVTPRLLTIVEDAGADRAIPPGVMAVLRDDAMWDAAAFAGPNALPALLALARRADGQGFPVVVRRIGHFGPAAKAAAPVFIPRVADPDADTRAGVRAVLARVHPDWKADPALTAALPTFLYQLPALPKAEADDLYAALGDIPETQSKGVRDAVDKKLRELNQGFRGPGVWDKTAPKRYEEALDEVFGPVERLGLKAKVLVPSFNAMLGSNRKELNDPKARVVAARLMRTLDAIDVPGGGDIARRLSALGTEDEALAFLRSRGKAAIPAVGDLIDHRAPEQRLLGYHAAAALGPDAAGLLPRLLAQLRNANVLAQPRFGEEVWMLGQLAATLTAIDPNWWARPEAAAALAELVRVRDIPGGREEAAARQRVFGLMTAGGAAAAPAVPRVAAGMIKDGGLDRPARDVFDKLAPDWRDDPAVRKEASGLVATLSGGINWKTQQTLTILGGAAVPALVAGLEALPGPFLTAQPPHGSAVNVIERLQVVLTEIGPPAKGATPALLKLTAKPEIHPAVATRVFDLLEKTDPGWAADPAYKAAVGAAGEALLKRTATAPEFFPLAARCGAPVVPELTRRLNAAVGVEKVQVLGWVATAGKSAKGAAPAVAKLVADKATPQVRLAAIDALGKIATGDPALAPALSPGLLDTEPAVRSKTGLALDAVDPAWRTKAAAKAAAAEAVKGLTSPDARKRFDAVGTLDVVGPADGVVAALTQLVGRETDANTKRYAEQVLARLRKAP